MSKVRLENEKMIDEVCRKICECYYGEGFDLQDYDDDFEVTDSVSVGDLKEINKDLGDGCIMLDEDEYQEIMRGACDNLSGMYIDMKRVWDKGLNRPFWLPQVSADIILETDGTIKVEWF